jgi:hypothetical protein
MLDSNGNEDGSISAEGVGESIMLKIFGPSRWN